MIDWLNKHIQKNTDRHWFHLKWALKFGLISKIKENVIPSWSMHSSLKSLKIYELANTHCSCRHIQINLVFKCQFWRWCALQRASNSIQSYSIPVHHFKLIKYCCKVHQLMNSSFFIFFLFENANWNFSRVDLAFNRIVIYIHLFAV